jgi:hypothetical protein
MGITTIAPPAIKLLDGRLHRSYVERLKNPPPNEAIELRKLLHGKTPDDQKGAGQVREE